MKWIAAVLLSLVAVKASAGCLQEDLQFARDYSAKVDRWKADGIITPRAYHLAKLDIADVELCGQAIDERGYCKEKIAHLTALTAKVPEPRPRGDESSSALVTVIEENHSLLRHLVEVRGRCADFLD